MNRKSPSKCARLLALVLLIGIYLGLPSAAFAQRICRSEADDWVLKQRGDLPNTYEELSLFPVNYRRAIYSLLSSETKSRLWQIQIERYLRQENELTEAQRVVLLEALQLATPEILGVLKERSNWRSRQARQNLIALEERARLAFGREKTGRIFARIGPADEDTLFFIDRQKAEILAPRLQTVNQVFDQKVLVTEPTCTCADRSDYCPSNENCKEGGCVRVTNECGFFWSYDCDGLCKVNSTTLTEVQ